MNHNIKQKLIDLISLSEEIHSLMLEEEYSFIKKITTCTYEVQIKADLRMLDELKDSSRKVNHFSGIMKSIVFPTYVDTPIQD